MKELIITSAIILVTLGIIFLTKIFVHNKMYTDIRPKAELTIQYGNDPCFEIRFQKLISSRIFMDFDVHICVIDMENTDESRKWLESLSKKAGIEFEIIN